MKQLKLYAKDYETIEKILNSDMYTDVFQLENNNNRIRFYIHINRRIINVTYTITKLWVMSGKILTKENYINDSLFIDVDCDIILKEVTNYYNTLCNSEVEFDTQLF